MKDIEHLNEAFINFTTASKSLEAYYDKLRDKVHYLTLELEEKNRQLIEALGETEEAKDHLKAILQSLGEAIIVLDPDKKVTMFNRAAEELLEMSAEEVIGKEYESLGLMIKKEENDTVLITSSKKYSIILSSSQVTDSLGTVRATVILIQDITKLKELEIQNERNHRLIAMGEMAAKIVHEIRSPLCSIELYASMLARELEGTSHMELAKGISSGISSLNNILTNMLFFAKPRKPLFRNVILNNLFDEIVYMIKPLLQSRNLEIKRYIDQDAEIRGDYELLKQLMFNILINAIQSSNPGKSIYVSIKKEERSLIVEITDEGEGIDNRNIEKIFDPFFSTKEKGTGLGLTIAARIVQAHGGSIKVKSEIGKGSSFIMCFPDKNDSDNSLWLQKGIFS